MKENYTLVLSSQNTTNRIGTTKKSLQYYINWNAILPKPENINQKYLVRFSFTSLAQASLIAEVYSLNIDFGGSNMYEQTNSKSTYLGYLYPLANYSSGAAGTYTTYSYSIAKSTDNVPVSIEYPNNSLITVNLVNINNASGTTFTNDYILTLEFIQI
jgi:hypothetical protein